MSKTKKILFTNTFYQLLGKVVSMTVTIIATIIVARLYGREAYGEFNLMQSYPAVFFIIVDFGINTIAVRELSATFENVDKYFFNILFFRILFSLLLIILVSFFILFSPYSNQLKLGISLGLFLILTQALYTTTNIIFQTKQNYLHSTVGYILGSLLTFMLIIFFSYLRLSVLWINLSYVFGGILTFLINMHFIRRYIKFRNMFYYVDIAFLKNILYTSLPLGLMFIFSQINFKADTIILSLLEVPSRFKLTNSEVVAIYGLPYKVFEVSLVLPTFFMNAAYPIFVSRYKQDVLEFKRVFKKTTFFLLGLGLVVSFVGVILSEFTINILGGVDYNQSVPVMIILMAGLFVFYVSQPFSYAIVVLNRQRVLPYIYFIAALLNLLLNLIFVPIYSFYASAVITWLSEIVILILLIHLYRKYTREVNAN